MKKMRRPVRVYVGAVIAVGALALLGAALFAPAPQVIEPLAVAILLAIAAITSIWPIHLSTKMKVTADDTATFAAAILFGPFVAMQIVLWASVFPQRLPAPTPLYNRLFNVAVKMLSVGGAATVYALTATPSAGVLANPLPAALAATAQYLIGIALVDGVVGLQLRRNPVKTWWRVHSREISYHSALYAFGLLAASVAESHTWALVLFGAPGAAVFVSLQQSARLRDQTRAAIRQMADLIDKRDRYTYGHSQRVSEYAQRLATRMKLSPAQVDLVTEAARMHDVGKLATPDHVLLKPGLLSTHERFVMSQHSETGYLLLRDLPDFWEGAALVRAHHERADGTGYPLALSAPDLPLEASIIAVCDAYDAMNSDRVYRPALSWPEIREEFERGRGTQWDARVVDECVAMFEEERAHAPVPALTARADSAAK